MQYNGYNIKMQREEATMDKLFIIYGDKAKMMAQKLLEKTHPESGLDRYAKIIIKPNLVVPKSWESGATTNPKIAQAVIEYFQSKGYHHLTIAEGSWLGADTQRAFEACGYTALSKTYGVPLLDTKHDDFVMKSYKGYDFEISKTALEADLIINLPVIKGHCQTDITCALKNLKGVISDREKRRFHTQGLHTPIAYLNAVVENVFTIADGIFGDLDFEEGGNPVKMDTMIASFDRVLLDSYAATLLSYSVSSIDYIRIANQQGVGQLYDGDAVYLNQPTVTGKLKRSSAVAKIKRHIDEDMACSACVGNLIRALYRMEDRERLSQICVGQGFKTKDVTVGIGRCANRDKKCVGCPPTSLEILDYLKKV
jgi:uncharacterized protein (DUF362 family)